MLTRRAWLAGIPAAIWAAHRFHRRTDVALKPENPVVGGTVLRRQAIQSPNYVPAVSGWTINQDGSVEFNNGTFRGTITGGQLFLYSGTPAAGNLVFSDANPGTTADQFGNAVIGGGASSYDPSGIASSVRAGGIAFYTGSLAGGWTSQAVINFNAGLSELFFAAGQVEFNASTFKTDGSLTVGGPNITAPGVTAINFDTATIDLMNGNLNMNMADPPFMAQVIAGTATTAQVMACLGGLLTSMQNRKLLH